MSAELDLQFKFLQMIGLLLAEADRLGLPMKLGRGLCCPNCSTETSLHRESLALDLPMIFQGGRYGTWEEYEPLGIFWEGLGGSWGGRFDLNHDGVGKDDPNHFSLMFQGRR